MRSVTDIFYGWFQYKYGREPDFRISGDLSQWVAFLDGYLASKHGLDYVNGKELS